jgi:hypothetical protein
MSMTTLLDVLCRIFPAVDQLWKNNKILAASLWKETEKRGACQDEITLLKATIQWHEEAQRAKLDQMAQNALEIQRLSVLLEAERSNKPHEPRTIRPRTAAEMRRLVEHQNAEEMEQEAV